MKRELIVSIITAILIFSVCICLLLAKNSGREFFSGETVTLNKLAPMESHVTEEVSSNLTIDADVKILIKNNFNTYCAKDMDYDFDAVINAFLQGTTVEERFSAEELQSAITENGTIFSLTGSVGAQDILTMQTKAVNEKDLAYVYLNEAVGNGRLEIERDTVFAKKELDFMSVEDACSLAHEKFKSLGWNIDHYDVYSVDYDYLKKLSETEEGVYRYTKDEEMYIVVPRIKLPNESVIAEAYCLLSDFNLFSSVNYAVVNKNGIVDLFLCGNFEILSENRARSKRILSLESAIDAFKNSYNDAVLQTQTTVYSIELSYFPVLTDKEQCLFELRPSWVFFTKSYGNYTKGSVRVIDAITGSEHANY